MSHGVIPVACDKICPCRLDGLWAKAGDDEERTLLGECFDLYGSQN